VRYAARINGLQAIALTKLDVLDGVERIEVAVAYRIGGRVVEEFPASLPPGEACAPVYESWPGWEAPTKGVTRYEALPDAARRYVARLEEVSGVPIALVSTGSDREETIIREDRPLAAWLKG
jgi:adenylosuccinate synthase